MDKNYILEKLAGAGVPYTPGRFLETMPGRIIARMTGKGDIIADMLKEYKRTKATGKYSGSFNQWVKETKEARLAKQTELDNEAVNQVIKNVGKNKDKYGDVGGLKLSPAAIAALGAGGLGAAYIYSKSNTPATPEQNYNPYGEVIQNQTGQPVIM